MTTESTAFWNLLASWLDAAQPPEPSVRERLPQPNTNPGQCRSWTWWLEGDADRADPVPVGVEDVAECIIAKAVRFSLRASDDNRRTLCKRCGTFVQRPTQPGLPPKNVCACRRGPPGVVSDRGFFEDWIIGAAGKPSRHILGEWCNYGSDFRWAGAFLIQLISDLLTAAQPSKVLAYSDCAHLLRHPLLCERADWSRLSPRALFRHMYHACQQNPDAISAAFESAVANLAQALVVPGNPAHEIDDAMDVEPTRCDAKRLPKASKKKAKPPKKNAKTTTTTTTTTTAIVKPSGQPLSPLLQPLSPPLQPLSPPLQHLSPPLQPLSPKVVQRVRWLEGSPPDLQTKMGPSIQLQERDKRPCNTARGVLDGNGDAARTANQMCK